jgi:hypothetical protein
MGAKAPAARRRHYISPRASIGSATCKYERQSPDPEKNRDLLEPTSPPLFFCLSSETYTQNQGYVALNRLGLTPDTGT